MYLTEGTHSTLLGILLTEVTIMGGEGKGKKSGVLPVILHGSWPTSALGPSCQGPNHWKWIAGAMLSSI